MPQDNVTGPAHPERQSSRVQDAVTRIADLATLCRRDGLEANACLYALLDAAIDLTGADRGNIQLVGEASGALWIAAQRGFGEEFLEFFGRVDDQSSACGVALATCERVIVDDVTTSALFAGTEAMNVLLRSGVRAVQSTPLTTGGGEVLGMISTHYNRPRRPQEHELSALTLLSNVAADHLEKAKIRQSARWSADQFNALLDVLPIPVWVALDRECLNVRGNTTAAVLLGVSQADNVSQFAAERGLAPLFRFFRDGRRVTADELPLQRAVASGEAQRDIELDLELPDGDRVTLSGAANPFFDDHGTVRGGVATFVDVTALSKAREAQDVLTRELQHRSNNLLAVILALCRLSFTGATSLEEAKNTLEARFHALARANHLLTRPNNQEVSIMQVVRSELEPFAERTKITGEDILLSPTEAQNVALAVHELTTNAVKYGALSSDGGMVGVEWNMDDMSEGFVVDFRWQEEGGPRVIAPARQGSGTRLVRSLFKDAELRYAPSGFTCELRLPINRP